MPHPSPHIALLGSRGIPARYGGFETFAEELAPRLVERGVEVTVFCEEPDSRGLPHPTKHRGVHLQYVPAIGPGPLGRITYDLGCLGRARKNFDLVYMLGYGTGFACGLPRLFGTPVWINMDGLEWRRSKWGPLARRWLKAMEGLACHSASRLVIDNGALADELVKRRQPSAPISVLAYGAQVLTEADPAPLAQYGLQPGGYDLTVCRAEPENHLLEVMRAHRTAGLPRPLVVIANSQRDNDYCAALRDLAGDGLVLLGPVYDAQALSALRLHSHLYLHGHSVGGTNPSLLEAMGCGAVVLAHDNPFNREVLADAGRFFVGEADCVRELQALEQSNGALLRDLRSRARRHVRERYSWEDLADAYANKILGALGLSRAKAAA
jgi:glycosyltransferase involved in cell wall biosynthesis